jgi:hypothetical protein
MSGRWDRSLEVDHQGDQQAPGRLSLKPAPSMAATAKPPPQQTQIQSHTPEPARHPGQRQRPGPRPGQWRCSPHGQWPERRRWPAPRRGRWRLPGRGHRPGRCRGRWPLRWHLRLPGTHGRSAGEGVGKEQGRHLASVALMCHAHACSSVLPPQPLTAVASLFAMAVPRPVAAAWELATAVPPLAALALAVATAVASSLRPANVGGEEGCK